LIAVAGDNTVVVLDRWGEDVALWYWSDGRVAGVAWAGDGSLAWLGSNPAVAVGTAPWEELVAEAHSGEPYWGEVETLWEWNREGVFFTGGAWGPEGLLAAYGRASMLLRTGYYVNATVYAFDPEGGVEWNLTFPEARDALDASWRPGGGELAVALYGDSKVVVVSADGEVLWETPAVEGRVYHEWSPDGDRLAVAYEAWDPETGASLVTIQVYTAQGELVGEHTAEGTIPTPMRPSLPAMWSSSGEYIAVSLNTPGGAANVLILDADANPVWAGAPEWGLELNPEAPPYYPMTAWHPRVDALAVAMTGEAAESPTAPWQTTLLVALLSLDGDPTVLAPPPPPAQETATTTCVTCQTVTTDSAGGETAWEPPTTQNQEDAADYEEEGPWEPPWWAALLLAVLAIIAAARRVLTLGR